MCQNTFIMEQTKNYILRMSDTITWLRFPLIFFIIMLHCYSVQRLEGNHELYFKILYPFSLWLGETGVPGFFFISGFLFFLSKKSYSNKLRTRIRTLLIPYLLWNFLLFALYLAAYATGFSPEINGRSIADFSIADYLRLFWDRGSFDNGNFVPLLCPLWYIRNLLIMSVLSPLLYYMIKYTREAFLLTVSVWWLITYDNAFIPQTFLFFSLGAYFSILAINPLQMVEEKKGLFIFLFAIFAIGDIISHTIFGTPINLQIHRLSLIFNLSALLLLADYCVKHHYTNQLLPNSAFIVFCVHYPIVIMLRKVCITKFSEATDAIHILLYLICVIISTLLSIGAYQLLDKYLPNVKRVLSGNR